MRSIACAWLGLLLSAAIGGAASANDSVAEMAAGGLVLIQSDDIDMLSEELFVSAGQIRVRYVFRNRQPEDVGVTVAFPMPERNLAELRHSDASWPAEFATRVDGRPVDMQVERRAMAAGADHNSLLAELGVPVFGDGLIAVTEAIEALPAEAQQRLVELGLVEAVEYDAGQGVRTYYEPLWTVTETWFWEQTFPAGRDLVVEHQYSPGAGASVTTALHIPEWRSSAEGRAWMERFCIDPAFLRALELLAARSGGGEAMIPERWVSYILTTGANWRSPIGEFTLTVDKGNPTHLVSFCGDGVRRISPTHFEIRRRDWRPDRDLEILFLAPPSSAGAN